MTLSFRRLLRFSVVFLAFVALAQPNFVAAQTDQSSEATAAASVTSATPSPLPSPNTNPLQVTLSPVSLLIETDPGVPVTTSFQILNNGAETEHLQVSFVKFTADGTGSSPVIVPFTPEDEHRTWLAATPNRFEVTPATWKTVSLTFAPPSDAALSYYYAVVVSRQVDVTPKDGETAVVGAPALLALATVRSPLVRQELLLKRFAVTKKVFEFLPVEFEITVENAGNIHLAPIGNIFINDKNGGDVGQLQINKSNGLILPGTTRTYTLTWDMGFPFFEKKQENGQVLLDAKGNPKTKLTWDFSKANLFRIGEYSGHLVFIYDNGERDVPTEATVSFWVIPWRILAVVGVVAVLVLLGITMPLFSLGKKIRQRNNHGSKK